MESTSGPPISLEKTPERADFLAPALIVSIIIAIFAVVAQLLNATSVALLSTTQILTMWLVALGLIALIWIAYMICQAYMTARAEKAKAEQARKQLNEALAAKAAAERVLKASQRELDEARHDAEQQKDDAEKAAAEAEKARAEALKASEQLNEARHATEQQKDDAEKAAAEAEKARAEVLQLNERLNEALMAKAAAEQALKAAQAEINRLVSLQGTTAVGSNPPATGRSPDGSGGGDEDAWVPPEEFRYLDGSEHSVSMGKVFPAGCYLEPDSIRLAVDELTGQQVYQYRILDLNPALKDRPHETVVKIPASQQPSLPPMPRFGWVEFDDPTITAYVIDRSQMQIRYSLRAKGIRPAVATVERFPAMWTAAGR